MGGSRCVVAVCAVVFLALSALSVCLAADTPPGSPDAPEAAAATSSDATTSPETTPGPAGPEDAPVKAEEADPAPTEVAALATPATATAADFLDKTLEHGFYKHWAERRAYLEQAADAPRPAARTPARPWYFSWRRTPTRATRPPPMRCSRRPDGGQWGC
jgi:hypothetical protein